MLSTLRSKIGFNPIRWLLNTRRMAQLVSSRPPAEPRTDGALHCAVLVTPWLGTSVPWFSVGIGLLLAREGHTITFILDDFTFGKNRFRYQFILLCLRSILVRLSKHHKVVVMSQVQSLESMDNQARQEVHNLAVLNTVWELRGEMIESGRQSFIDLCERQLTLAYPAIHATVKQHKFDLIFMPGGVWGTTGIWASSARASGIRIGSFDSGGYGTAMLAVDGIACQLQDIPKAFALISQGADVAHSLSVAKQAALNEMERRRAGIDPFMSQVIGSNGGDSRYDGAILIALNSSWDSAALGLHTIFENNSDWIVQTVKLLLEKTDVPVIVRQHPAERLEIARTTDDYARLLRQHFGTHPRLHFIAAADKINSYELMSRVSALVVYTSTIGIEAAANGKPVVTPSRSYYSNLGFVYKATDFNQYQNLLISAALGDLKINDEKREDALICYYLTQCCNWVFSPFNPADYSEWSACSLDEWSQDKNVRKMIRALSDNLPIAFLNHTEKLSGQQ